jgi:hypothetical protein
VNSWHFGDVRVDRILEFEGPLLPPQQLFPRSTTEAIDRHRHWLEPRLLDPSSGLLIIAFHSFLIRSQGLTILVDTCGGNDKSRPQKLRYHMSRWPYLEHLARIGAGAVGVNPPETAMIRMAKKPRYPALASSYLHTQGRNDDGYNGAIARRRSKASSGGK